MLADPASSAIMAFRQRKSFHTSFGESREGYVSHTLGAMANDILVLTSSTCTLITYTQNCDYCSDETALVIEAYRPQGRHYSALLSSS